ncbi:MAG: ATP-dependent Clp protease proteolytic subunit [Clostridia bacterium]|nr:ATP-dependent Clp protease proteolytic subunit [Oscillospiraceae bacterium]MBQ6797436.1 ATP-dependent Clp protease proteolytic subunit [Clostridia bacterium]
MMPMITTYDKQGRNTMDLFTNEFMELRRIHLTGEINDDLADQIIAQIEYLARKSSDDITVVINSPGGAVTSGFAIYDAMNRCGCDVSTVCTGLAASMGAFLFSAGKKGKRFITPMAEVMIHQPLGGVKGQASDIARAAAHITVTKERINAILADNTGQTIENIARDTDRDTYLTAQEAVEYGIADEILTAI